MADVKGDMHCWWEQMFMMGHKFEMQQTQFWRIPSLHGIAW